MTDVNVFDIRGRLIATRPFAGPAAEALMRMTPRPAGREGMAPSEGLDRRWYIAESEPNREGLAMAHLIGRRFIAYSPSLMVTRQAGRKFREVRRPMFPGYIFLAFDLRVDAWQRVFALPGLRGMLMSGDRLAEVSPAQMELIRATEAEKEKARQLAKDRKRPSPFTLGQAVRIAEGAFTDLMGIIDELDDAHRITVLLTLFGRRTKVIASASQLSPAP